MSYYGTAPVAVTSGDHDNRGGYMAALLIVIVLVVLFAAWGGRRDGYGDYHGHGGHDGYDKWRPSDFVTMSRSEDRDIAYLKAEGERNTRILEKDVDTQACKTRELIEEEARRCAERDAYARECALKDKLEEERFKVAELKNLHLFDKTNMHIDKLECDMKNMFGKLESELPKVPPLYAHVEMPATKNCGEDPFRGFPRHRG